MIVFRGLVVALCVSYAMSAPPTTVSTPNANVVATRLGLWFSYVQRGFESIATSIGAVKRGLMDERERVSAVVNDVRAVENGQKDILDELKQTASDLSAMRASLSLLQSLQPRCSVGWTLHNGNCYRFTQCTDSPSCTFDNARDLCLANGSMLASVKSEAENTFISGLATTNVTHVIIGGRDDVKEGRWLWADGTPVVFTFWYPGEPNNGYDGTQDCMMMWRHGGNRWDDGRCRHQHNHKRTGYVCQLPAWVAIDTTN